MRKEQNIQKHDDKVLSEIAVNFMYFREHPYLVRSSE